MNSTRTEQRSASVDDRTSGRSGNEHRKRPKIQRPAYSTAAASDSHNIIRMEHDYAATDVRHPAVINTPAVQRSCNVDLLDEERIDNATSDRQRDPSNPRTSVRQPLATADRHVFNSNHDNSSTRPASATSAAEVQHGSRDDLSEVHSALNTLRGSIDNTSETIRSQQAATRRNHGDWSDNGNVTDTARPNTPGLLARELLAACEAEEQRHSSPTTNEFNDVRGRRTSTTDTDVPASEHESIASSVNRHRLRSTITTATQRRTRGAMNYSTGSGREQSDDDRRGRESEVEVHPACRRGLPPGDDDGDDDPSSSDGDERRNNDRRKNFKREDSDSEARGRRRRRHRNTSRSTSRRRHRKEARSKSSEQHQRSTSSTSQRQSSRHRHKHHIKIDKYDGSSCVEVFLCQFEGIADYNDWDEEDKLVHLKAALTGTASYLVYESRGLTYEDMKEKLRTRYGTREQQERFKVELRTRRRSHNESLQDLSHDIERLVALAYPDTSSELRDVLGRDAFIDALNNTSLEFKVKEKETPTLAKALTTALRLEALYKSKKTADDFSKPRHPVRFGGSQPDGAADRPLESRDEEFNRETTSPKSTKNTKTKKKNEKTTGERQTAAVIRQEPKATRDDDGRRTGEEFDRKLRQLESKIDTKLDTKMELITQQINSLLSQLQVDQQQQPAQPQQPQRSPTSQASMQRRPAADSGGGMNSQHQQFYCYECGAPGHIARNCERRRQAVNGSQNQPPEQARMINASKHAARFCDQRFRFGRQTYQNEACVTCVNDTQSRLRSRARV